MSKSVGEYVLKERLGKGNYAEVFLGTHKQTKERFAIKVIAKETFAEPKLLAGLEAEIKIMKEVHHVNLLTLVKYFSSEKNFYLVMEFCAGGDLSKFLRKHGPLSETTAFNFLTQLTEGLVVLHQNSFLHRDLKPANVLLTEFSENCTLKIADFGFARNLSGALLAQTRCGTPLYMAPEILEARDYDAKADMWSVGCIFFEMLFNSYPFSGVNETDLLNNIRNKTLRAPGNVVVSRVAMDILSRLLERQVSRRASSTELLDVLRYLRSKPEELAASVANAQLTQNTQTTQSSAPSVEESLSQKSPFSPTPVNAMSGSVSFGTAPPSLTPNPPRQEREQPERKQEEREAAQERELPRNSDEEDYDVIDMEDAVSPHSSRAQVNVPAFSTHTVPAPTPSLSPQMTLRGRSGSAGAAELTTNSAKLNSTQINTARSFGASVVDTDVLTFAERLGEQMHALLSFADRVVDIPTVYQTLSLPTPTPSPSSSPSMTAHNIKHITSPTASAATKVFSSVSSTALAMSSPPPSSSSALAVNKETTELLDALIRALRLHALCLTILKSQLEEREKRAKATNGFASQPTLQFLLQELWSVYLSVLSRYEQLYALTEKLLSAFPPLRAIHPQEVSLEQMLFQEALKGDENGGVEDALGNNEKSLRWFVYARGLVAAIPPTNAAVLYPRLNIFQENLEKKITSCREKEQAVSTLLH